LNINKSSAVFVFTSDSKLAPDFTAGFAGVAAGFVEVEAGFGAPDLAAGAAGLVCANKEFAAKKANAIRSSVFLFIYS
jgi:hypothetical protein